MPIPNEVDPLVKLVVDQLKPGALLVTPADTEDNFRENYSSFNLDIERVKSRVGLIAFAIARRQLAGVVIESSEIVTSLNDLVDLRLGLRRVANLSIAQALVHLETDRITIEGRQQQPADTVSLEGSLLGYANCDIRYYVATRYFQQEADEVSNELLWTDSLSVEWPDPHVLCGSCAEDKLVEFQS